MVEQLIRDYANPSKNDPQYPFLRNFDPYEGHSWAGGYGDNNNGNNQEAAGESLFGWVGEYMWGLLSGNDDYPRYRHLRLHDRAEGRGAILVQL